MSSVGQPQFLTSAVLEANGAYSVTLNWVNAVNYDKIIVAWGVGTTTDAPSPNSAEPDSSAEIYTIAGCTPDTSFVFKVKGGVHGDLLQGTDPAEIYYSDWTAIVVALPLLGASPVTSVFPQLLLYKRATGQAFTGALTSPTALQQIVQVGSWQTDWAALVPFGIGADRFLMFYETNGRTFSSPLINNSATGLSTIAALTQIGSWDTDWAQLGSFSLNGGSFLLLYKQSTGLAYTMSIGPGVHLGPIAEIGRWDRDWTIAAPFSSGGGAFIFFYKQSTGHAYTAPITSPTSIGGTTQIGVWDKDWAIISPFTLNDETFLLLYKQSTGHAYTAPLPTPASMGALTQIGVWDRDWTHAGPFNF
jgi:hypothetical protein